MVVILVGTYRHGLKALWVDLKISLMVVLSVLVSLFAVQWLKDDLSNRFYALGTAIVVVGIIWTPLAVKSFRELKE